MAPRNVNTDPKQPQWRFAVAFAAFAMAILHLIILNISPGAPIWRLTDDHPKQAAIERQYADDAEMFRDLANGGNLAMQFNGINIDDATQCLLVSQLYYRAVYALYPRRVFVGGDDAIINSAADLRASSNLADDAWLARHGIRGVIQVQVRPGEIQTESRSIPKE